MTWPVVHLCVDVDCESAAPWGRERWVPDALEVGREGCDGVLRERSAG